MIRPLLKLTGVAWALQAIDIDTMYYLLALVGALGAGLAAIVHSRNDRRHDEITQGYMRDLWEHVAQQGQRLAVLESRLDAFEPTIREAWTGHVARLGMVEYRIDHLAAQIDGLEEAKDPADAAEPETAQG